MNTDSTLSDNIQKHNYTIDPQSENDNDSNPVINTNELAINQISMNTNNNSLSKSTTIIPPSISNTYKENKINQQNHQNPIQQNQSQLYKPQFSLADIQSIVAQLQSQTFSQNKKNILSNIVNP